VLLPIHLLSAKVRLFVAEESDPPAFVGLTAAPYLREPPDNEEEEEEEEDGEDGGDSPQPCSNTGEQRTRAADEGDNPDEAEEDEAEEEEEDTGSVSFFRLFRNEFNWNRYMEEMERRWEEAARTAMASATGAGAGVIPEAVLSDLEVSYYCVVASEASDLVTSADTLAKRGLPLELTHPELLQGSEEGMAFLRELGEKLMREAQHLP